MPAIHLLPFLLLLTACAPRATEIVAEARQRLIGMDADELRSCAGIPTRTLRLNDGSDLFSYEQRNLNVGGLTVSFPLAGGGFHLAGSGSYCHALFRVVQGRVASVVYTGDSDDVAGQDGVCAPIVRGCLRQLDTAGMPDAAPQTAAPQQ